MTKIRVWKLGNLEHKIIPTAFAAEKLAKMLETLRETKEDWFDIIWGPDLEVNVLDEDVRKDIVLMDELCVSYLESKGYKVTPPFAKLS